VPRDIEIYSLCSHFVLCNFADKQQHYTLKTVVRNVQKNNIWTPLKIENLTDFSSRHLITCSTDENEQNWFGNDMRVSK